MDKFTSKHLGFVIVGVAVVSLKSYPSLFTRNGGRDTWIAMGVGCILSLFYLLFMLHIFKKSNYLSLVDIYTAAVGKWIGRLFLFLFIGTIFLTLVESASVEANSMHTNMLLGTPSWMLLLFFIPPALYTVKKGIASIMTITLISMVLVSLSGINLSILTASYKHFNYILPILENGVTKGLILSMLQILGVYGCVSIIFPYITDIKDRKHMIKHQMIAMIFVIQMEFVAMAGVIMTFNIDLLNTMSYPKLLQTQLISQYQFLEFGELFVMLQMVGGWFIKYVLSFVALVKLIESIKLEIKYLSYWVSVLCFVCSSFISRNLFLLFEFLNYYSYICLINFIIIPFLIFMIYALRGFPNAAPLPAPETHHSKKLR
ncbi:MAG: spore gernimation protein [Firmicutes bacterium HGW-Firmicutes-1]|jgi:spore germination protein (amino acid permease)|nr:MAG: spore gernimation protein [Firmicutes bacterium HGW-Firmicutes-1]